MNVQDMTTPLVVDAPCGKLQGVRKGPVAAFKGIPFAKPPVGRRRWAPPEPLEPWAGVREAVAFGNVCPQAPTVLEGIIGSTMGEQADDCLYLNVWTPGLDGPKRPVMVWFHGGAFVLGAGSQGIYNGRALAERTGVVVVTVNYRLGSFGFLNLRDATSGAIPGSGSEGLLDQIASLHWVKANIEAFGGDPGNVTIFGESAGGMSVSALLASPLAKGLFHKAIAQSGGAHIGYDRDRAARVGRAVLEELGLTPSDGQRLYDAPYAAIIKAQIAILTDSRDGDDRRRLGRMPFQPCIDGDVIPIRPIDAVRDGSAAGVPLMTGTTLEEWKLFSAAVPSLRMMFERGLEKRVVRSFGEADGRRLLAAYAQGSPFERWNQIQTARVFALPADRLALAQRAHEPRVYVYRFDWKSPFMGGMFGACHALELGFMWGTHTIKMANKFFGTGPDAERLATTMMDAWAAFAANGDPETHATGGWNAYDGNRPMMVFSGEGARLQHAPGETQRRVWDEIPEKKLGV